jgi:hypothetical protein
MESETRIHIMKSLVNVGHTAAKALEIMLDARGVMATQFAGLSTLQALTCSPKGTAMPQQCRLT